MSNQVITGATSSRSTKALNPGSDSKGNWDAQKISMNKCEIGSGTIHQGGKVTKSFCINTPDPLHTMYMDMDGERKGWTTFQGPGNFQLNHGKKNDPEQQTIFIHAENGDITIKATNGIIRLEANQIQLNARDDKTSKGDVRINASENVHIETKKFEVNATKHFKIMSSGVGKVTANSMLTVYGSICKLVDDSCALKDSKNLLQPTVIENNIL